ncbi:MAG: hypothetical protein WBE79_15980 [Candidatus Cybelea sp.]
MGTGLIDHRRPGLEIIRGVIDDRSKGRRYRHRLMDYNNDPTTTLADVQSSFSEALRAMTESRLAQRSAVFRPEISSNRTENRPNGIRSFSRSFQRPSLMLAQRL